MIVVLVTHQADINLVLHVHALMDTLKKVNMHVRHALTVV